LNAVLLSFALVLGLELSSRTNLESLALMVKSLALRVKSLLTTLVECKQLMLWSSTLWKASHRHLFKAPVKATGYSLHHHCCR